MKLAYVILTHAGASQVKRLFDRLNIPGTTFIIHVSKTCEPGFNKTICYEFRDYENVLFCKREDGTHLQFGIVQAVINALQLLIDKNIDFGYVSVISGSDYPIKSNEHIKDFFKKNYGKQFLWYLPVNNYTTIDVPLGSIYGEGWDIKKHPWTEINRFIRFKKYWYWIFGERLMIPENRFIDKPLYSVIKIFLYSMGRYYHQKKLKREFLLMLLSVIHKKERIHPQGYPPYAGSQWFSVTKNCCEYILKTHKERPELKKYFKRTLLPDESFFTTILVHSPYKDKIAQSNYRFIRWEGEDRTHPVTLTKEDFPALKKSEKLFARKFDINLDKEILDMIDRGILFAPSRLRTLP